MDRPILRAVRRRAPLIVAALLAVCAGVALAQSGREPAAPLSGPSPSPLALTKEGPRASQIAERSEPRFPKETKVLERTPHGPWPVGLGGEGEAPTSGPIAIPHCRVTLINDVQLASARMGILADVAAEGSRIPQGQPVAHIEDDLVRIGLQIAEQEAANDVEIRFAEKASEFAQLKYVRALDANTRASGAVSELELKELRLDAERSLLQLEQARQRFLTAQLRRDESRALLERCRILAPFDTIVVQVYKQPGEVVREGEPILQAANTDRVRIEGRLPVAAVGRVRPGVPVEVVLDGPDAPPHSAAHRFPGEIGFVDVKVEPVSRTIRVWAEVANHNGLLRDGMTATMTLHTK